MRNINNNHKNQSNHSNHKQSKSAVQHQTLLDNKREYVEHMSDLLADVAIGSMVNLYQEVQKAARPRNVLRDFQAKLEEIPRWNAQQIHGEYQKVLEKRCTYLPDLIKATLITYTHLALIQPNGKLKKVNVKLTVPNPENFLHRIYINLARHLWQKPELMYHNCPEMERQANLNSCAALLGRAIRSAIRESLPYELLLKQVVNDNAVANEDDDEDEESESSEEESESSEEESKAI